jgi:hypothetical protein
MLSRRSGAACRPRFSTVLNGQQHSRLGATDAEPLHGAARQDSPLCKPAGAGCAPVAYAGRSGLWKSWTDFHFGPRSPRPRLPSSAKEPFVRLHAATVAR